MNRSLSLSSMASQVYVNVDAAACDSLQARVQDLSNAAIVDTTYAAVLLSVLSDNKTLILRECKRESQAWFLLYWQLGFLQTAQYDRVDTLTRSALSMRHRLYPETMAYRAHLYDRHGQSLKKRGEYHRADWAFSRAARHSRGAYTVQIRAQFFINWAWNDYLWGHPRQASRRLRQPLELLKRECADGNCPEPYRHFIKEGARLRFLLDSAGYYDVEMPDSSANDDGQTPLDVMTFVFLGGVIALAWLFGRVLIPRWIGGAHRESDQHK